MSEDKTKTIDFGEQTKEYSRTAKAEIVVAQMPKYKKSKEKAIKLINEEKYGLESSDFWILMNETKGNTPKMLYSGLIISHNACLKINDAQKPENKFKPSCVTLDKEGYGNSLVLTYSNDEQGIYEVGEVSGSNCTNAYKYAMALKRLFDRVVLKITKIAFDGIYSDSESEELKENQLPDSDSTINEQSVLTTDDFIKQIEEQKSMQGLITLFNENQDFINGNVEILSVFKKCKAKFPTKPKVKQKEEV